MNESPNSNLNLEVQNVKSNVLIGTIGAIIGALLGAVLWVVIYQIGFVASIAGIAIVFCSYKGYTLLSKRRDKKAAIIAVIVSVLVLCAAHYFCWGLEIYNQFSVNYDISMMDAMRSVPTIVFNSDLAAADSSIVIGFFKDLLIGLILIAVGYSTYIRKDLQSAS